MDAKDTQKTDTALRPPVVVIMGHIDHGKTTLLDCIRSSHIAAGESGSITQHIGAYEVDHNGKRVTFLDTPGHESFSRMRMRGARVADVAILVIAADDGVKPQTVEAIRAAKEVGIPFLVVINKIDRPEADVNRVKSELAEHDVLVEGWGGTVPVAEISAKTCAGISDLLDLVLLAAEMEELTASAGHPGSGIVIESHRDRKRGVVATLLIKDGTVRRGDWIQSGKEVTAIRTMEDCAGNTVEEASFSSPVRVLGFSLPPVVGDTFLVHANKKEAEEAAQREPLRTNAVVGAEEMPEGTRVIPLVIKADVAGSQEALEGEIGKLGDASFIIKILRSDVGDISDDDVKSAFGLEGSIIVGFKVKVSPSAHTLAERYGVVIHTSDIIYELLDWLSAELLRRVPAVPARVEEGVLQVLRVFKKEGSSAVFGGKVLRGSIRSGATFEVTREGTVVGSGTVTNAQRSKMDVKEVEAGFECGLAASFSGRIAEGDTVTAFVEHAEKK